MSRIGKLPITIPAKVEVKVTPDAIHVKGPKGELTQKLVDGVKILVDGSTLTVERQSEAKHHRALHGLYRSLISNMVTGVSQGFRKEQELVGVGYKASNQGQLLDMVLGYSHHFIFEIPAEIKVSTKQEKGQNPTIILESADKQLLGAVAAKIRSLRTPEPYKGKGIKFTGEVLRRKAGKSAAKKIIEVMLRKQLRRNSIRTRIRRTIKGTAERPRLSVYRSNKQIYAQLIDDVNGITLAAASSSSKDFATDGNKVAIASAVGKAIAEKAKSSGISSVVFDRGGYLYHGRVKALAEGAREGGLQF